MFLCVPLTGVNRKLSSIRAGSDHPNRAGDLYAWCLIFGLALFAIAHGSPFAGRDLLDNESVIDPGAITRHGADSCFESPVVANISEPEPSIGVPAHVSR
jgi:hypothetical protein